jgi:hypothetical protein
MAACVAISSSAWSTSCKLSKVVYLTFSSDEVGFTAGSRQKLNELGVTAEGSIVEVVILLGYHRKETAPASRAAAIRRLDAIKSYLVERGIPSDRFFLEPKAVSARNPLVDGTVALTDGIVYVELIGHDRVCINSPSPYRGPRQ